VRRALALSALLLGLRLLAAEVIPPPPGKYFNDYAQVVSAETAARHARRLRVPLAVELDLLVVHGLLHLAGYDDHDPRRARRMHERAREILAGRSTRAVPARLWAGLLEA